MRAQVLLVVVSFVAAVGHGAMSLAAGIWVLAITGSSGLAALVGFFVFAPTLLGPVIGALADRAPARPVLVATNLALAALLPSLLAVRDAGGVWQIFAVMLAYGLSYIVVDAAEARLVVAVVPRNAIGRLGGLRLGAQESTKLFAPLLGAGLFALAGGPAVALLAAGALLASAVIYLFVRPVAPPSPPRHRRLWTDLATGLRHLRTQPLVWRPAWVATIAMLASGLGTAGVYAVVTHGLHRTPVFLGVLSSVQGGASVVGGLVTGRLLAWLGGETRLAVLGAAVFAAGPLLQSTGWLAAALVGSTCVGLGLPWTVVAAFTAVQRHTPYELVGAVTGCVTTLVFAPPALGIPLGSLLVSTVDYHIPLLVAVALAVAAAAAGWLPRTATEWAGPGNPLSPPAGSAEAPRRAERDPAGT